MGPLHSMARMELPGPICRCRRQWDRRSPSAAHGAEAGWVMGAHEGHGAGFGEHARVAEFIGASSRGFERAGTSERG